MLTVVRPAGVEDLNSVAELLVEMDEFYGEPERESIETKLAHLHEYLFGAVPSAHLLIAQDDGSATVLGIAAYSFLWPAIGTTRSLYLKELYVIRERRRDGVGRRLMNELYAVARAAGCTRLEWTTDGDNVEARRFYASLGAKPDDSKILYRSTIELGVPGEG